MASMCRSFGRLYRQTGHNQIFAISSVQKIMACQCSPAMTSQYIHNNGQLDFRITQNRYMSDGRKGFFQTLADNLKQELAKNKEMKENLKKFKEETEKLEQTEAIQKARQKFQNIESESIKGSQVLKKHIGDIKEKVSETFEEVQKTEFAKRMKESTDEIGKTVGKAAENISKQSQQFGQSSTFRNISQGVKAVKEEFDEVTLSRAKHYRAPEVLRMRSETVTTKKEEKEFAANEDDTGVVLHKDSKWYQSWQNFKDNNEYVNKMFDLKTKYDESDHLMIRATRALTDKVGYVFGKNIAKLLVNNVDAHNVPLTNCIAFGSDNAPVMVGKNNGVIASLREKHAKMYLSGCPCHLIHLAAEKATATLPFTPVKVDEALVDTFYYLDKSSNRLGELEVWQQFLEVEHQKILKHGKTRWLSIGVCLDRLIENWEALKNLFRDEVAKLPDNDTDCRERRMLKFYRSPTNKLLCLFLRNAMKIFDTINTRLQLRAPLIHVLRRNLHKLMRDLLLRYKTPGALRGRTVTEVNVETELGQRNDAELLIGDTARDFITRKAEVGLRDKRIEEFYSGVRKFFISACKYVKEKLPLNDILLRHAEVADVTLRLNGVQSGDLRYFLDTYPSMLPQGGMFTKTEMSEVLTEVCKCDPNFDKEKFIKMCEREIIPNILEAMVRGELDILKDWCHEAAFNVLAQPIKQIQSARYKSVSRVLDVSNVDVVAGKIMEQGPVLVISFNAQQIMAITDSKGKVVEGDPDKINKIIYVWALCRDQEELNPRAAWKLMDISASSSELWL